jgi:nicotinate-nucleotide adenylyltransferase
MVAAWLRWSDQVDEVWLVPTPAHPFSKELVDYELRVKLCQALAQQVGPWVKVSRIEYELPKPNYSITTLRALTERFPEHSFRLVVGADTVSEWPKWRDWDQIERLYSPIVVGRQGYPTPEGAIDFPNISSTEVRERLRRGDDVCHLLSPAVLGLLTGVYQQENS